MRISLLAVACLLAGSLFAQSAPSSSTAPVEPSPEFSIDNIDKTVNPCTDFLPVCLW